MRRTFACSLVSMLFAIGCGGDGGGDDAPPADAPGTTQNVMMVACTGTPPTITAMDGRFEPSSVTISVNGLVNFITTSSHNVVSTTSGQNFTVPFSSNQCLQFKAAGTYTFKCGPHSFTGSVVVQ